MTGLSRPRPHGNNPAPADHLRLSYHVSKLDPSKFASNQSSNRLLPYSMTSIGFFPATYPMTRSHPMTRRTTTCLISSPAGSMMTRLCLLSSLARPTTTTHTSHLHLPTRPQLMPLRQS